MDILGLSFDLFLLIIYPIILIIIALIVFGFLPIKRVKKSERLVISRRGRFIGIAGPGLVLINPINYRVLRIKLNDLDEKVPGWQGLSKEELDNKTKTLIQGLPKKRAVRECSWDDCISATISGKVQKKYLHDKKRRNSTILQAALGGPGAAWGYDKYSYPYHLILHSSRDVFKVNLRDYKRVREGDVITITYNPRSRIVKRIERIERIGPGEDFANVAKDLEALAELYEAQGKDVEAARLRKKAIEKREEFKKLQRH